MPTTLPNYRFRTVTKLLAIAIVVGLLPTAPVAAQVTNKMLIGDAVSEPDSPRYVNVANAIERYGNRDILAARTFLEAAKLKDSKLPPAAVMLAKLHALAGNVKSVRPALEECINEAPDDPEPYLILAEEAVRGGRTIEADALFDKAVLLMQSFDQNAKRKRDFTIRAYSGRANIARLRKKWDQAESDLNALLKEDPENAAAHYALGQTMFLFDEPRAKDGLAEFSKARDLDPTRPHPYVAAGQAFDSLGKLSEAMQYYAGAYKSAPDDETVVVSYAQGLLKNSEVDKAQGVLASGASKFADNASLWLLRGVAARMKNETDEAEQHYLRTLALNPGNGVAYNQLALTLGESSDEEAKRRALGFAVASQKLNPKDPDANITLAWLLIQNGKARQASNLLQNLQMSNVDPDSSLLLAKILIKSNQKDAAKKLLARALEDNRHIFIGRDEAVALQASM